MKGDPRYYEGLLEMVEAKNTTEVNQLIKQGYEFLFHGVESETKFYEGVTAGTPAMYSISKTSYHLGKFKPGFETREGAPKLGTPQGSGSTGGSQKPKTYCK